MLDVSDDEITRRILGRGLVSGRADDLDEAIIRKRIEVYKNETSPVFDYYHQKGKSHQIFGIGTIDDIFERLCATIEGFEAEPHGE